MANEIYNITWWGITLDTASSIGTSTDLLQGQFNMADRAVEDSGIVEAKKCLADAMRLIGIQDTLN